MEAVNFENRHYVYNPVSMAEVVLLGKMVTDHLLSLYPSSIYEGRDGMSLDTGGIEESINAADDSVEAFEDYIQSQQYENGEPIAPEVEWGIYEKYLDGLVTLGNYDPKSFKWTREEYFRNKESMRLLMREDILIKSIRSGSHIVNMGIYYGSPRYMMVMKRLANVMFNGVLLLCKPTNRHMYVTVCGRKADLLSNEEIKKHIVKNQPITFV